MRRKLSPLERIWWASGGEVTLLASRVVKTFMTTVLSLGDDGPEEMRRISFSGVVSEAEFERLLIANPALAGEELLVLGSQLAEFEEDRDRLDVLAVDRAGELVLLELKVSEDFKTTDLQAIAYAGAYSARTPAELAQTFARGPAKDLADAEAQITDFVNGLESFDQWEPSRKVRIKLIAPRFPKRVLHNVRYLGDVYGMPIEAIEARLFEDSKGQRQLSVARLLPLPDEDEFDLTRKHQADRQSAENTARSVRPSALKLLMQHGIVTTGSTLYILPAMLKAECRERFAPDDPAFKVTVADTSGPRRVSWSPTGTADDAELLAPSQVQQRLWRHQGVWDGAEFSSPVAEFYSLTPNGQDLRAELETRGLW